MHSKKILYLFSGIIAAIGALVVEMILLVIFDEKDTLPINRLTIMLFLFVIIEESFKLSVIFKSLSSSSFFLPSFYISLGFALTEIFLAYFKNIGIANDNFLWLLAGVGAIHLITGVIDGYSAFFYKKNRCVLIPLLLFFLAIALHLIYNVAIIELVKN